MKEEPLNYALLAGLNTQPRTTYLAALSNPNPELIEEVASHAAGNRSTPGSPGQPENGSPPVIGPGYTFRSIADKISSITLMRHTPFGWWVGFGISFVFVLVMLYTIAYLLLAASDLGHQHSGGLGLRHRQFRVVDRHRPRRHADLGHSAAVAPEWRTSINRFAEAMTLFAVACAGLFPLLHLGRPWFFYWLIPYPNTMDLAAVPQPADLGHVRG